MTTNNIDLDDLEAKLAGTVGMTNSGQAERDRDYAKTGALLSIARSLEANKVPDHWESLEGPSGAILGWFDPQVARAIAQALGATEARQATDEAAPDPLPVIVGSVVALTEALTFALDQGDPSLAGLGEVLDIGVSEGAYYAIVKWDDEPDTDPGKVWLTDLTALEAREGVPVDDATATARGSVDWIDPAEEDDEPEPDEREADIIEGVDTALADNSGFDIEPDDGAGDPAPEPVVDDTDIDDDFDIVVDDTPPAVDGLTALKGKSKGGKR